jgi:iron complex outermembrane receptor protein
VFPGFSPVDATDRSRTAAAAYLDVESDLTKQWLVGAAARFENFSDFGSQATGKVTTRFAPSTKFALRGAASTGFRAPSLQQSFFTSTATTFVNGLPVDIKTLPVASAEAKLLGARELKPENSVNLSAGVTLQPTSSFTVTADYYDIAITDRIVLSENFIGTGVVNFFKARGFTGIGGGRYFTNAINTKTTGLDVVVNYGIDLKANGVLRFTGGYNQNRTKVTKVVVNTPAELGNLNEVLFGRAERGRIEEGQPRNNLLLTGMYERGKLGVTLRTQRFGKVVSRQALATGTARQVPDLVLSPKFITDLSASYQLPGRTTLTIGADNILDVYPDQITDLGDVAAGYSGQGTFGIYRFSGLSPFGFNGRYLFARFSVGL